MKVITLVLNAEGEPHFQSEDTFDFQNLLLVAKSREQEVREKGANWTAGGISFFGTEVVKAVNTGEHDDVSKAIIQMLMVSWLFDSQFCSMTADHYLKSDMKFTISADGIVARTLVTIPG